MTKRGRGRPVKYPELHDRTWMTANLHRSAKSIAEELDCPPQVVYNRRSRMNLRSTRRGGGGRPQFPELRDRDWMQANLHRAASCIADELGCAQQTVWIYRTALGLKSTRDQKQLTITDEELRRRLLSGETLDRIAEEFGVTKQRVQQRANQAGLRRGWVYRPDTETAEEVAA